MITGKRRGGGGGGIQKKKKKEEKKNVGWVEENFRFIPDFN